jgi:hypothetical protein
MKKNHRGRRVYAEDTKEGKKIYPSVSSVVNN